MERRSPPPRDREEFERYCMTPGFRTLHHPETLVDQLVAQRAQALLAVPSVGRDIKTGLLLPPPLSGQPVSSATKLVKLDNLPDSVVAHAYPALLAAGAGGATAAPPDSSVNTAASARGRSLTAMIFGEPVRADNMRAKAWALYADEAGARTASAALLKLPQLSELVESVQASVEAFAPPVEPPPPQLSSESVKRHCERCDGIVTALEARLDMPGACQAALGKVGAACGDAERLQLLVHYLRRVYCFDYPSGRLLPSQGEQLFTCGEVQPSAQLSFFDSREADGCFALPFHFPSGPTEFAAEAFFKLTRELSRLDASFGTILAETTDSFYKANCVEEEANKFRCPLSGKLFREEGFVRKHIDNKHGPAVAKARAKPLGRKYLEYFLAIAALTPPPRPRPRPQQREGRDDRRPSLGDGRDEGPRRGGFPPDRRDSFDGPGGKGGGKGGGGGSPYGKGKGKDSGKGKGGGKGGGEGGMADPRSMKSYKDLDAPDDDDALFS